MSKITLTLETEQLFTTISDLLSNATDAQSAFWLIHEVDNQHTWIHSKATWDDMANISKNAALMLIAAILPSNVDHERFAEIVTIVDEHDSNLLIEELLKLIGATHEPAE